LRIILLATHQPWMESMSDWRSVQSVAQLKVQTILVSTN